MEPVTTVTIPQEQNATQENFVSRDDFIAFEKKFTSAYRRVTFLTLMCGVFFLLTTVASAACFYFYTEMQALSRDIPSIHGDEMDSLSDSLQMGDGYEFSGYEYSSGASSRMSQGRDRQKRKIESDCKCAKKMKRLRRSMKKETDKLKKALKKLQALISATTARTETTATEAKTKTAPSSHMQFAGAAHYTSSVDDNFISEKFGAIDLSSSSKDGLCKHMKHWNGVLCRNRTFTTHGKPATLNMFREADWMKNDSMPRIFNQSDDGSFVARRSGLYQVYVHVQFRGKRGAVALRHKSRDELYEVKNYVTCIADRTADDVNYPCAATAVIIINERETLSLELLEDGSDSMMSVREDLYFGAFFIHEIV